MQSSRWGLLQTQATHCSDKLFGVSLVWVPDLTSKNCRLEVVREQTKICCLGQFSIDESHVLRQDFWFGGCQVSQVVFWVGHQTHQTFYKWGMAGMDGNFRHAEARSRRGSQRGNNSWRHEMTGLCQGRHEKAWIQQEVLPKVCRKRASVPSRNVVKDVRCALRLEWF